MRDNSRIRGVVRAQVFGPDGRPKRRERLTVGVVAAIIVTAGWRLRDALEMLKWEVSINHNIVTNEGDALIADQMADTPARTKVNNANGYIQVGTGWTGTTPKANTAVNTSTGSPKAMSASYPQVKGAFGAADDNVTQYRSVFAAGDLNETGIDEAALLNNVTPGSADCLAYAQITPSVNVGLTDTLQVDWELTFLGA